MLVANNKKLQRLETPKPGLVRRISKAVAAAVLTLASTSIFALGLGEIESKSYLGDAFNARINLVSIDGDIDTNNLIVRLVPLEEAEQMGVDYFYSPYRFQFEVVESAGSIFVTVTTREAVKEPFIDLLVELRWPSGVVYRQYSVLLDPAPVVTQAEKSRAESRPATPKALGESTAPATIPVRARTQKPAPSSSNLQSGDQEYTVRPGDTLYKIADNWRQGSDASLNETSEWIFENNPRAFVRGDMNLLKAGASLRMPDLRNGALAEAEAIVDDSEAAPTVSANTEVPEALGEPESRQKSLDDFGNEESSQKGLLTVGNATRDDRTRELIDLLVRENQALKARMERLESSEYLSTMRELVLLQRQQIEELRYELGVEGGATAEEVDRMLESIGLDEKVVLSNRSLASETPVTSETETVDNREAVPQTEEASLVEIQPSSVVTLNDPDSWFNKPWVLWAVFASGILIAAIFIGIFVVYRRMTAMPADEAEETVYEEEELPPLEEEAVDLEEIRDEPELKTELSELDLSDLEAESLSLDLDMHLESHEEFLSSENGEWFGERAGLDEPDEELAETIKNIQQEFSDLPIDDADDELANEPLEAITQELKKDSKSRRSDEEVRMSIAEKMANYSPELSRMELSGVELDHLEDFYTEDDDDIEGIVYRALMYCEFKKFDEARALVQGKMAEVQDEMLESTLKKIDTMQSDYQKRANG